MVDNFCTDFETSLFTIITIANPHYQTFSGLLFNFFYKCFILRIDSLIFSHIIISTNKFFTRLIFTIKCSWVSFRIWVPLYIVNYTINVFILRNSFIPSFFCATPVMIVRIYCTVTCFSRMASTALPKLFTLFGASTFFCGFLK